MGDRGLIPYIHYTVGNYFNEDILQKGMLNDYCVFEPIIIRLLVIFSSDEQIDEFGEFQSYFNLMY